MGHRDEKKHSESKDLLECKLNNAKTEKPKSYETT